MAKKPAKKKAIMKRPSKSDKKGFSSDAEEASDESTGPDGDGKVDLQKVTEKKDPVAGKDYIEHTCSVCLPRWCPGCGWIDFHGSGMQQKYGRLKGNRLGHPAQGCPPWMELRGGWKIEAIKR